MTLAWILAASVAGGTLSAGLASVALTLRAAWVPMLVSYAIGALLGAAPGAASPSTARRCTPASSR